ncbi:MAG TPA: TonB-dependent receptor plug domain-containing protein [Sphingobium sp.]|uniref:TonB-dependent receptor plug domain-containing protein n=1 Tax=Sphingobium sp. TaxID=1912891 RepID=UPI002ED1F27C
MTRTIFIANMRSTAASALVASAFFISPAVALAQPGGTTPPTTAQTDTDDNNVIVVTGSLIRRTDLESQSPILAVQGDDMKLAGQSRVEDLINSLPQSFSGQNSGSANGADGTATVNLRNLKPTRTLVLVDGRRLPPGDPSRVAGSDDGSAADLNFIPSFLVKRVDVLTGGASATYGADAVAGVVNFILDKDFTGIKGDAQGAFFLHQNNSPYEQVIANDPRGFGYPTGQTADGGTYDVSLAAGKKFGDDRGHIVVYGTYHSQRAVTQASRDYSACGFTTNASTISALDNLSCAGSRNSAVANFLTDSGSQTDYGAGGSFTLANNGQSTRPFENGDRYNFNPLQHFQRPDERYNFGGFLSYDFSDAAQFYFDGMYMRDKSVAQIAPSGTFGNVFTVNCSNPLLSTAVASGLGCTAPGTGSLQTVGVSVFKRNVEGGGRQDDLEHRAFRLLGGLKGDFAKVWHYDVSFQWGKTIYNETYLNDFSKSRVQNAINACLNPDGTPIGDTSCSPYNIFTGTTTLQQSAAAGVTQAGLNYVSTPGQKSGFIDEIVASGVVTGDLGDYGITSPWATKGVNVAFGAEYRRQKLRLDTDQEFSTGDLLGQGGETKSTMGSFNVKELFTEVNAPLVGNVTGFQDLTLSAAYRFSSYSSVGDTNTWKIGLDWSPFAGDSLSGLRFRGSINRAVRAPTLQDLYAPSQLGLNGTNDPCADGGATAAACAFTGRNDPNFAAHYAGGIASNPASQYNAQSAGAITAGSTLSPEVAITKTAGMVFAPRSGPLRRLAVAIDYFDINLKDTIQKDGFDLIMSQCLNTGSNYYCSLIKRDPLNGSLWLGSGGYIVDPIYNGGRRKTSGIDFSGSYDMPTDRWGRFSLSFNGTLLLTEKTEVLAHNADGSLSSLGYYSCVGVYGDNCGVPSPRWRHRARVSWRSDVGVGLSVSWRHFSGTEWEARDPNPLQPASVTNDVNVAGPFDRIKPYDYIDLVLTFNVGNQAQFRLGANNLLDRDPPVINGADFSSSVQNGNSFPGTYDVLGRYVFAGFSFKI